MTKKGIALTYAASGYSVIPLKPRSKQALHSWAEFQERCATPAEIDAWWDEEPEANIGIVTGAISGIIVGDVDPRNGGSVEQMERDAPSPFVVQTPGGGAHFYYRHPGGRVKKGKPRAGIDRQSDGCYVVAAGSYVVTDRYEGEYKVVSAGPVSDRLPSWLLGDPEPHASAPVERPTNERWIAHALTEGCPPGTRNDTLTKLAGYMAGKGLPMDVTAAFLVPWVRSQQGTGVSEAEAASTIRSIYEKDRSAYHYVVDEFDTKKATGPLEQMHLRDFIEKFYQERVEWLIPDWLPARTIAFLVSPPGRFKTFLTFDAAVSIAGGWPFLGQFPVQHPGPVLVIQQEDDYGDMARRFNRIFGARCKNKPSFSVSGDTMTFSAGDDFPDVHICTSRGFTLDGIEGLRRLEDTIRKTLPRAVIIDPLYSITNAQDFMMRAAKDMMPLKRLRDTFGCAFLIAAHTKKGSNEGREGLWGSQFLNAFMETGWQIRDREDGDDNQIQLRRHFKSAPTPSRLNLEFIIPEGHKISEYEYDTLDEYKVDVREAEDEDEKPSDPILDELAKHPEGVSAEMVAERTGMPAKTVYNRLTKHRKAGLVVNKKVEGKGIWFIPAEKVDTTAPPEESDG